MLADDALGATREDVEPPLSSSYFEAFETLAADPHNDIVLAVSDEGTIVGFLQLTFIPGLTYRGSWRAQIEGVRVRSDIRGGGIGAALIEHAVARAEQHGCRLVQLTSDKSRADALRFYEKLGFTATHEGFKRSLDPRRDA